MYQNAFNYMVKRLYKMYRYKGPTHALNLDQCNFLLQMNFNGFYMPSKGSAQISLLSTYVYMCITP